MFGVVLWSDEEDGKAVFWCEDQGDLAFYEERAAMVERPAHFDAGDMVQFDLVTENRLRRVKNPRLVQEKAYQGLPDHLRRGASAPATSAKVLPFVLPDAQKGQGPLPKVKCEG